MIEVVRSLDDERIADYAHVGDPAWLRGRGLFVAEGRLVVRRLLESSRFTVRSLLVTPAALEALTDVAHQGTQPIYVCDQRTLDGVTGFNFHRGCLALARRPDIPAALDATVWPIGPGLSESGFSSAGARVIALEGVGNPDNVGGIFRVAAAFGVDGVLLDSTSGDPLYRKAIRTSMGAALRVPFAIATDWTAEVARLRREGFAIVALTPDPGATPLAHYASATGVGARVVLMLGAEGDGLSAAAFAVADARVRIPIDTGVDSLNVVIAAGIALARLAEG